MTIRFLKTLIWLACFFVSTAFAHEVHHSIASGTAVVVQLTYADGEPFAYEAFEATPADAKIPTQVGRTDAQGRAVFMSDKTKHWQFKAYSSDGHGVSLKLDAPATATENVDSRRRHSGQSPSRLTLMLFGLSLIFFVFGLYQLWIRKKQ